MYMYRYTISYHTILCYIISYHIICYLYYLQFLRLPSSATAAAAHRLAAASACTADAGAAVNPRTESPQARNL